MRVFDGQLCILQRFLYGARPYPEVIAFAEALAAEALRLGAARGHAFGMTIRGEAELLAGDLQAAEEHLTQGVQLHRAIGAATGEAFAMQRLAEVAMHRGRHDDARALIDEALDLARQTDIGFHLLDRIYGTRILLARTPGAALHALEDAREAVRGPLETCPGCRITFAVPAAIAAARAGRLDLAEEYAGQTAYLADVVMRLPAWHAAHDEVRGHMAVARGEGAEVAASRFAKAAQLFRDAGHPIDAARCDRLADSGSTEVEDPARSSARDYSHEIPSPSTESSAFRSPNRDDQSINLRESLAAKSDGPEMADNRKPTYAFCPRLPAYLDTANGSAPPDRTSAAARRRRAE